MVISSTDQLSTIWSKGTHMNKQALGTIALVLTLLAFGGCRTAPIYNPTKTTFVTSSNPSLEKIEQAIADAGTSLGWIMTAKDKNHIIGTLHLRAHTAVVDIYYDANSYKIAYRQSTNLKYDGKKIHKNYNSWIHNLERAINLRVNGL